MPILSSLTSLRPKRRDWDLARRDLVGGLAAHDIWMLLGTNDIRLRYNRSKFGQFWITLSMAIFIGGIGFVYSTLFGQPMQDYLPFLAVNITIWTLISGTIIDSSTVFTQAAVFMRQDALPRTVFVLRLMVRNVIVLAHNLVIVPLAFLIFLVRPSWTVVLAVPGLAIVLVALFFITLVLGVLATRFRDLPQIVQNGMQLFFFVTPIMWRSDQLKDQRELVILLNPFASLLRIVSDPLLGRVPPVESYATAGVFVVILAAIALPFFARFRARLVYWL